MREWANQFNLIFGYHMDLLIIDSIQYGHKSIFEPLRFKFFICCAPPALTKILETSLRRLWLQVYFIINIHPLTMIMIGVNTCQPFNQLSYSLFIQTSTETLYLYENYNLHPTRLTNIFNPLRLISQCL